MIPSVKAIEEGKAQRHNPVFLEKMGNVDNASIANSLSVLHNTR
jgi:hypothetical protein